MKERENVSVKASTPQQHRQNVGQTAFHSTAEAANEWKDKKESESLFTVNVF